jgi:hypothetical protein
MSITTTSATAVDLNHMRFQSDDWADRAIDSLLGPWYVQTAENSAHTTPRMPDWEKLKAMSSVMAQWDSNTAIKNWRGDPTVLPDAVSRAMKEYVSAATDMPAWADAEKLARAERVFMDYGPLSVMMLFCSSLPECYVVPDLSAVLITTGQLVDRTEHRVRSTGAMIFPVMMRGGLTDKDGGGLAQIFKVRLIHATIRHLILRKGPEAMLAAIAAAPEGMNQRPGFVPPLMLAEAKPDMFRALFAHGWDVDVLGLPCNQEELLYTLMTFSYVFLRSMRILSIPLSREDEEAYIHCWNVAGHFLGIKHELMPQTYDEAEALFNDIQRAGRARVDAVTSVTPDGRAELGQALMAAMETVIPTETLKAWPTLLTRRLCGETSSRDLGLTKPISLWKRFVFSLAIDGALMFDRIVRVFAPNFSLARWISRRMGYHLVAKILMDQTRTLQLPEHVKQRINEQASLWGIRSPQ